MTSSLTRAGALSAAVCLLALAACATREVDYQGEGEGFVGPGVEVQAVLVFNGAVGDVDAQAAFGFAG